MVPVSAVDMEDIEDGDKKKKKARTTFTGKQIFELERQFETKKYLSSNERMDLARSLAVTETQVSKMSMRAQRINFHKQCLFNTVNKRCTASGRLVRGASSISLLTE